MRTLLLNTPVTTTLTPISTLALVRLSKDIAYAFTKDLIKLYYALSKELELI
jgi:hypothetical protein